MKNLFYSAFLFGMLTACNSQPASEAPAATEQAPAETTTTTDTTAGATDTTASAGDSTVVAPQ